MTRRRHLTYLLDQVVGLQAALDGEISDDGR